MLWTKGRDCQHLAEHLHASNEGTYEQCQITMILYICSNQQQRMRPLEPTRGSIACPLNA